MEQQEAVVVSHEDTGLHQQPPMLGQELHGLVMADGFTADDNTDTVVDQQVKSFSTNGFSPKDSNYHYQQPWLLPPTAVGDNLNLPWDLSAEQVSLCSSAKNLFGGSARQLALSSENRPRSDIFFEGPTPAHPVVSDKHEAVEHGFQEMVALQQCLLANGDSLLHPSMLPESTPNKEELGHDRDSVKLESGKADTVSDCSDQIEDEDDQKVVGRTSGRKHQSKNLVAERKRRKKLNERLYSLRSLVPKISKMDRASILGDAIEFVKELQKKVKDLQDELEEPSDDERAKGATGIGYHGNDNRNNSSNTAATDQNGSVYNNLTNPENDKLVMGMSTLGMIDHGTGRSSSVSKTTEASTQNPDSVITDDKTTQQMEVQVEVTQVDGNEFFLKVFCEHRTGGFARLMEAMNSLGLEVTNANVTTFRGLVLNVFKVEQKRDNEVVQADHVKESLLELTRNSEPVASSENGLMADYHHHHHRRHLHFHHLQNQA
uniref:Transcription factor ABORTED MICROSPORES-like n=1 Tax=Nelumbo nucifera TaxID=4432 RepID=A0A822YRK2_NELNU|nr:TPA_asm: hypothetical protein HUJ06_007465 [Nelumbo nucifera]